MQILDLPGSESGVVGLEEGQEVCFSTFPSHTPVTRPLTLAVSPLRTPVAVP